MLGSRHTSDIRSWQKGIGSEQAKVAERGSTPVGLEAANAAFASCSGVREPSQFPDAQFALRSTAFAVMAAMNTLRSITCNTNNKNASNVLAL
jgi:hypothetical protein